MLMATFHDEPDSGSVVWAKGAPGKIIGLCTRELADDGERTIDAQRREELLEVNRRLAGDGLRVLAFASGNLAHETPADESALTDLTFLGVAGLMDPPADGVAATIERLHSAGIRTIMITGDQLLTADAVAERLGLRDDHHETLDGRTVLSLSDEALAERVRAVATFARTSPEDKLRIVRALQDGGEVVGMLGDGVNDAPALKQADIGVAMGGRGTDIAKETAEMVLSDDRFETVAAAVEEGRVVFDNIRKFILYLFSCNLSEALVVVGSVVAGLPLPLLPLQIPLAQPGDRRLPRPRTGGRAGRSERDAPPAPGSGRGDPVARIHRSGLRLRGDHHDRDPDRFLWALGSSPQDLARARTIAFATLAFAQLLHVFNARSVAPVLLGRRALENRWVLGAIALTVGLQLAAIYWRPLGEVLRTVPLSGADWLAVAAASTLPLALGQLGKLARGGVAARSAAS